MQKFKIDCEKSKIVKGALDKRLKAAVTADSGFQSPQSEPQGVAVTARYNLFYLAVR